MILVTQSYFCMCSASLSLSIFLIGRDMAGPGFILLGASFVCCTPPNLEFWCLPKPYAPLQCYRQCETGRRFVSFLTPLTDKALQVSFFVVLVLWKSSRDRLHLLRLIGLLSRNLAAAVVCCSKVFLLEMDP